MLCSHVELVSLSLLSYTFISSSFHTTRKEGIKARRTSVKDFHNLITTKKDNRYKKEEDQTTIIHNTNCLIQTTIRVTKTITWVM
jgi:hypothetical protein